MSVVKARLGAALGFCAVVAAACGSPSASNPAGGDDGGSDAGAGADGQMTGEAGAGDGSPDAATCSPAQPDGGTTSGCGCSGNPGTLQSDATGPCIRYAAPTGMLANTPACSIGSCDVVYRFDKAYACGQFANGDYFVVPPSGGKVDVTAIEPAAVVNGATLRHGFDVNPATHGTSPQHWDSRVGASSPPPALPYAASPGDSIVKYVSAHADWTEMQGGGFDDDCYDSSPGIFSKSCGQFAAVLTVLGSAPPCPAATFRPPYVGTFKPLLSTAGLKTQILSRLPAGCCADKIDGATATAWTTYLRLDYTDDSIYCDNAAPMDAEPSGRSWSTDIWRGDTQLVEWLSLADVCGHPPCSAADDLAAKMPVLIGYVQQGIDVWGVDHLGISLFRGGGGNGGGKLFVYAFAAALLGDPQMNAAIAAVDPTHFFETGAYYAGQNGVALWGQPGALVGATEADYWSDLANPPGATKTIRDPYGWIDGGGSPGGAYQDNTAKPTEYSALLMRLMPAFQAAWPSNAGVILDYVDRWVSHGAHTLPDPCAPVQGTYGVNYGPDGKGGCIKGSGRVPSLDGNNKNGGNRDDAFGDEMWTAFRTCAATCTCPGQSCAK
jgi:hypothetical protein